MKKKIKYTEGPIGKIERVEDFLPPPEELILKEKRKWNSEQEKIKNDLLRLEKNFNSAIENLDVSEAVGIFEKGSNLLTNLIDDKIRNRWEQFNKKIQHVREK